MNKLTHNIILEPAGRNTAPAIALAAMTALQTVDGEDPLLLVLAADHVIRDQGRFYCCRATRLFMLRLVSWLHSVLCRLIQRRLRLYPDAVRPRGMLILLLSSSRSLMQVLPKFICVSREYYWNSGMFLFRAGRFLAELKQFRPDIFSACELAVGTVNPDLDFVRVNKSAFLACPSDSIDYAVMGEDS